MDRHNNLQFTTFDNDNDNDSDENCSDKRGQGGWWFDDRTDSNLNGKNCGAGSCQLNHFGIYWYAFMPSTRSLKITTMSIRPV